MPNFQGTDLNFGHHLMNLRFLIFLFVCLGLMTHGCSCEEEPIQKVETEFKCEIKECDSGEAYRNGQCVREGCEADSDCCPGTRCRSDLNMCWPFELEADFACESDGDCPNPSMRCAEKVIGERQPLRICQFDSCDNDGECGRGQSCFSGVCVATVPCDTSCEMGAVCDVLTGWCTQVPTDAVGCDDSCKSDEVLVLSEPTLMRGESCCEVRCACAKRPPIQPVRYGPYTRVAASPEKVWVATYEEAFGDLMVLQYDHDGNELLSEIVDGVPPEGELLGDPNGARGGVSEPGPDVGTHIALVLSDTGLPRIAYFNATTRSLNLAVFDGAEWLMHQVQGPLEGDEVGFIGRYNAIAIDAATGGLLIATHFGNLRQADGTLRSGVRLARAAHTAPSSAADWNFVDIKTHWPVGACMGSCAEGEACIAQGEISVCAAIVGDCTGCPSGSVCVSESQDGGLGQGFCAEAALDPSEGPIAAAGQYNQLYSDATATLLGSYDGRFGSLQLITVLTDGTFESETLDGDGQGAHPSHDVGRHLDIASHEGQTLVSYMDFTTHAFRYWLGDPLMDNGEFGVIDNGASIDQPGLGFVGASGQMVASVTGVVSVVYQNATDLNLKMASFQGGEWIPRSLLSTGSHGFFSDIAVYGNKAFIVAMEEQLDARGINQPYLWFLVEQVP